MRREMKKSRKKVKEKIRNLESKIISLEKDGRVEKWNWKRE